MKNVSLLIMILVFPALNAGAQKSLKGTWVLEKITIDNKELAEAIHPDTLRFAETDYKQAILRKEANTEFMWIQSGKYQLKGKKLRLYERQSSTGEPGKFYSELNYTCLIKNDVLMLSSTEEGEMPGGEKITIAVKRLYNKQYTP